MHAQRQEHDVHTNRRSRRAHAAPAIASGQGLGRNLLSLTEWQLVGRQLKLSPRELELVQHIFDGKKMLAIARDMNLSLGTVKSYSQRIHQKLQIVDQVELALAIVGVVRRQVPRPAR